MDEKSGAEVLEKTVEDEITEQAQKSLTLAELKKIGTPLEFSGYYSVDSDSRKLIYAPRNDGTELYFLRRIIDSSNETLSRT